MSDNMADKLKRKLSGKSITAMVIFSAIILVFVFFGYQGKLGASGAGVVGRVNNSLISIAELSAAQERVEQYYKGMFGGQFDLSTQRQLMRQQAVQQLVNGELVSQAAAKDGILITDQEIRDFITQDIPVFQDQGQFDRNRYLSYLEMTHESAADFENKLRKDNASMRARHLFELVAHPSAVELKQDQALRDEKINVSFVKINQEALTKDIGKEKVEAAVKSLDEALAKGDEAAVNGVLKGLKGVTWEETGYVGLDSDSLPKLNTPAVSEGVFDLTSAQPLLKRLVRDGNFKYILKLKGVKIEEGKPLEPKMAAMSAQRRAEGQFESWVNQFRKESRITVNNEALQ